MRRAYRVIYTKRRTAIIMTDALSDPESDGGDNWETGFGYEILLETDNQQMYNKAKKDNVMLIANTWMYKVLEGAMTVFIAPSRTLYIHVFAISITLSFFALLYICWLSVSNNIS
eukprot:TRINITY_DN30081_c0_g1_i1.p2 TRINITY_DN30081_c0_g1~~TRINITY_DN30081_c0_g1_i1.p2  ORF type:complete len:115 (-),score=18.52 TRINITY_DN30081_c0_g1_i1:151-495(-)